MTRKSVALMATAALGASAMVVPVIANATTGNAAKTAKFKFTVAKLGNKNGALSGKVTSTPFGKGTVSGKAAPPVVTTKFKLKGGTITASVKDGKAVGANITGTFTLKGTGKYKKIKAKGKGKVVGSLATSKYVWSGTATY